MTDDRRAIKEMAAEFVRREVVPHLDEFGERWLRTLELPRDDAVLLGLDTRTAAVWRPRIGWRAVGAGRVAVIGSDGRIERTDGGRLPGIDRPASRVRTA